MFLILLSPAKSLDFEKKLNCKISTIPTFISESKILVDQLLNMGKNEIGKLMGISDKLIELNYNRYKAWDEDFNTSNSTIFGLFNSDGFISILSVSICDTI